MPPERAAARMPPERAAARMPLDSAAPRIHADLAGARVRHDGAPTPTPQSHTPNIPNGYPRACRRKVFEQSFEVNAPVEVVRAFLLDPFTFPKIHPLIAEVTVVGTRTEGSVRVTAFDALALVPVVGLQFRNRLRCEAFDDAAQPLAVRERSAFRRWRWIRPTRSRRSRPMGRGAGGVRARRRMNGAFGRPGTRDRGVARRSRAYGRAPSSLLALLAPGCPRCHRLFCGGPERGGQGRPMPAHPPILDARTVQGRPMRAHPPILDARTVQGRPMPAHPPTVDAAPGPPRRRQRPQDPHPTI